MSSAPAGWYDDGSGRTRRWDGEQWTDEYAPDAPATVAAVEPAASAFSGMRTVMAEKFASLTKSETSDDPDTIWEATGKPLTGIGVGRYRLTPEFLYFERGTLSTKAQQIHTREIHDVDAKQTMTQKARGLGTITLKAERVGGAETIVLEDIPDFREGVLQINRASQAAREAWRVKQSTTHMAYSGGVPGLIPGASAGFVNPAPAVEPARIDGFDLNTELAKLAAYRDSGVLDAEEFAAAKRKLLGL